jgi:16S rRNA (cytidine1402-2'-O)-methyltransferase
MKEITAAAERDHTSIFFESPHRLTRALAEIAQVFPLEARICVARELTKMFEEVFVGTPTEAAAKFAGKTKGEITLVLSPLAPAPTSSSSG